MSASEGLLAGLPYRSVVRSRQISAENPTGERNEGAKAVPDPANLDLPHSRAAADLGRGFKVRPFLRAAAGERITLANISGAGTIRHIWITSDVPDLSALRLQMFWDGSNAPAVDVTLASFFCLAGPGQGHTVTSIPITVAPTRGCSSYWSMPFATGAAIQLVNEGDVDANVVAYKVSYEETESGEVSASRFHARTVAGKPDARTSEFGIATIPGDGLFVGTSLTWRALTSRWWGEGEVKFYLGDDEFPSLIDTGTEDYFGGAWGFGRDSSFMPGGPIGERTFSGLHAGVPYQQTNEGYPREIALYRWHLNDPVGFENGLRVAVQSLGQGLGGKYEVRADDLVATGYWYSR